MFSTYLMFLCNLFNIVNFEVQEPNGLSPQILDELPLYRGDIPELSRKEVYDFLEKILLCSYCCIKLLFGMVIKVCYECLLILILGGIGRQFCC